MCYAEVLNQPHTVASVESGLPKDSMWCSIRTNCASTAQISWTERCDCVRSRTLQTNSVRFTTWCVKSIKLPWFILEGIYIHLWFKIGTFLKFYHLTVVVMSVKNSSPIVCIWERRFHIDERILKHKEGSEAQVSAADAIIGDLTAAGGNADIWKTHIWSHLRIFMAWTKKRVSSWNRKGKRLQAFTTRYWGLCLQTRWTLSDSVAWK